MRKVRVSKMFFMQLMQFLQADERFTYSTEPERNLILHTPEGKTLVFVEGLVPPEERSLVTFP